MYQPEDFLNRLIRRKPYWFHGNPTVQLFGEEKQFGEIAFYFPDEKVVFRLYINNKEEILKIANEAILNQKELVQTLHQFWEDQRY